MEAGKNLYWGNFLACFPLIVLLYFFHKKGESQVSLTQYFLPKKILLHRSSLIDYKYFFVSKVVLFFSLPILMFVLNSIHDGFNVLYEFLIKVSDLQPLQIDLGDGGIYLYFLVSFLCLDFALFFAHWLMHKIPFFWEFHKVHHSAQVLNPITVVRIHPVDFYLNAVVITVVLGLKEYVWVSFFTQTYEPLLLLGTSVTLLLIYGGDGLLRHSHVWLSYGPWAEKIFISPAQHQIHHSSAEEHFDKNMGMKLAIWDWMAGTLHTATFKEQELKLGLYRGEDRDYQTVHNCLFVPFKKLYENRKKVSKIKRTKATSQS